MISEKEENVGLGHLSIVRLFIGWQIWPWVCSQL